MRLRDRITLQKIISEMNIGMQILGDMSEEEFLHDEILKRALSMTVINVGELVKTVTEDLRTAHKEFPWKAVAGMRDVTAHRYQTLRMEDVYVTVHDEYPELRQMLQRILDTEPYTD